jgi:hypothetical protein
MDYRELLKKYIAHVEHEEGVNFIDWIGDAYAKEAGFTKEEIDTLKKIADEIDND